MTTPPSVRSTRGPVRFEGVLKKQEPKSNGSGVAWTSRYFVLNDNKLMYWRIKDTNIVERDVHPEVVTTGNPVGQYDLSKAEVSLGDQRDGTVFEIFPQNEAPVPLQATSKEECLAWVQTIRKSKQRAMEGGGETPINPRNLSDALRGSTSAVVSATPPRQQMSSSAPPLQVVTPTLGGEDSATVNQLRIQLRESQLRHEATLEANKKALAAVGTKHYQEKQQLLEKIAVLEGRTDDVGMGVALSDLEGELARLRGELSAERARSQDALSRLESTAGRTQTLQADLEGAKALLTVEKRRSAELQDQLDAASRRNTELQIENERLRGGTSTGGSGSTGRGQASKENESLQMLLVEMKAKCTGLEAALRNSEQSAQEHALETERMRALNSSIKSQMDLIRNDLEDQVRSAMAAAEASGREVGQMRGQLEAEREKAVQMTREADRRTREVAILQASLEGQVNQDRDVMRDLQNRSESMEAQLRAAQMEADQKRREVDLAREQLRQTREDLADERNRTIVRLRSLEDDRAKTEEERIRLTQRIESNAAAIEQLDADLARAEHARNEAEQLLQDQRLVNKALRARLDDVSEELREGRDMLGDAEKRVAAAVHNATREVENERLRTEDAEQAVVEATRAVQQKDYRISELERSLADRRSQQEAMTQHFDQLVEGLRADASAAVARATAAEQRASNAEHELEQILGTRTTSDRMTTQYAKQIRDLKAELDVALDEKEAANQKLRDLQKRYDMSTSLVDQFKRTNDRQSRDIEDLKHDLEVSRTRSSSTVVSGRGSQNLRGSGVLSSLPASASVTFIDDPRRRDLEAEAKYAELVRASDSLVEEMTRDKNLLQERINQLESQATPLQAQIDFLKRENAELLDKAEREQATGQHLRRQLQELDIQLNDKSRQVLEQSMFRQNGASQRNSDLHMLETELVALRAERERMHIQIEKQQSLLDAKDAAITRERKVMQDTLLVERTQRQQLEEENIRLRQLAASPGASASSPFPQNDFERSRYQQQLQQLEAQLRSRNESHEAEVLSLKAMLKDEQQHRLGLDQQLRAASNAAGGNATLQHQLAVVTEERDAALQRIQALKQLLIQKSREYDELNNARAGR